MFLEVFQDEFTHNFNFWEKSVIKSADAETSKMLKFALFFQNKLFLLLSLIKKSNFKQLIKIILKYDQYLFISINRIDKFEKINCGIT